MVGCTIRPRTVGPHCRLRELPARVIWLRSFGPGKRSWFGVGSWRMAMPIPERCCRLIRPANRSLGRPCPFWTDSQADPAMPVFGRVNDSSSGAGATARAHCSPTVPSGILPRRSGLTSMPQGLRPPDSMPPRCGAETNWWCSVAPAIKAHCPAGLPGVFRPGSGEPCLLRAALEPGVGRWLPGLDPIC